MPSAAPRIESPLAAERLRRARELFALAALLLAFGGTAEADEPHCATETARETAYVVCRFDPKTDDIRLFHAGADGEPFRHFGRIDQELAGKGERLLFAMNAGMYQANRTPVGLYIEGGVTRRALNTRSCKGNFCWKPNGVFWIDASRAAHVTKADDYAAAAPAPRYATQSGPMLVIDGALHPDFRADSASLYRRNGVGVTAEGEVVFAISEAPVTFHEFASLFRYDLKAPNALYLDGAISRLYSTEIDRNEPGAAMGPIVGVVESSSASPEEDAIQGVRKK